MSLISRLLIGLLVAVLALLSGCEVQKAGVKTVQVQLSSIIKMRRDAHFHGQGAATRTSRRECERN